MSDGWDPRTRGIAQLLTSAVVVAALALVGIAVVPHPYQQILVFVLIAVIAAAAYVLASLLRKRFR